MMVGYKDKIDVLDGCEMGALCLEGAAVGTGGLGMMARGVCTCIGEAGPGEKWSGMGRKNVEYSQDASSGGICPLNWS